MNSKTAQRDKTTAAGAGRRYLREILSATVAYAILIVLISTLVDFQTAGWWKYPVALLPVLPAFWAIGAVVRHIARIDEMQRLVMLDGLAVGFGVAMISSMTLGFVSLAGLDINKWGPWVIYVAGMLGWIVGSGVASRRRA